MKPKQKTWKDYQKKRDYKPHILSILALILLLTVYIIASNADTTLITR